MLIRKNGYNFVTRKFDDMVYLIQDIHHHWYVLDEGSHWTDGLSQSKDGRIFMVLGAFSSTTDVEHWLRNKVVSPTLPIDNFITILELFYMNELVGRETVNKVLEGIGWTRDEVDDRICELNGCVRPIPNANKIDIKRK